MGFRYNRWYMKPRSVPLSKLEQIDVSKEELEVLRLRYIEKLNQTEASKQMGISQSQYQRDLEKVLKKITDALINGKAISIEE